MTRCAGIKADGTRCTHEASGLQIWCWAHDPDHADARRKRARSGGKAKANSDVKDLRVQLQDLTDRVVNGTLETSRGAVANQLVSTQIKLLEYSRRLRETEDLVARLEEFEGALQEQRAGDRGYGISG